MKTRRRGSRKKKYTVNQALREAAKVTTLELRKHILKLLDEECARHWKMRGTHVRGKYFERGFFRGLNHARSIIRKMLDPVKVRIIFGKGGDR